jgi:hypothetical protein
MFGLGGGRGSSLTSACGSEGDPGAHMLSEAAADAALFRVPRCAAAPPCSCSLCATTSRSSSASTAAHRPQDRALRMRACAGPASSPPARAGSASAGPRRRAGRWSRPPGARSASPARCVPTTARKLAVLFWCMLTRGQDYAHQQPSLTAQKLRRLVIIAGAPTCKGKPSGVWVTHAKMCHAENSAPRWRRPPTSGWSATGRPRH